MTDARRAILVWLLSLVAALGALEALGQHAVALKSSARLNGTVLLGDIAKVSGPDASAIRAIVMIDDLDTMPAEARWHAVTIDDVRAAIDEASNRDAWGLIRFSGRACAVAVRVETVADASPNEEAAPEEETLPPGARVRDWVIVKLASMLGVERDDIRVTFRETDAEVLNRPVLGRPVTVQPLGMSRAVPVKIRMYEPSGAIREDVVRGEIEVRRSILRVVHSIQRHSSVTFESIATETSWVPADVTSPTIENALGSIAKRSLSPGEILKTLDVERPIIIKRGELARVHCLSGSLIVECEARALGDGRLGDTVEFRPMLAGSRRDGSAFRAVVRGPGLAVLEARPRTSVEDTK